MDRNNAIVILKKLINYTKEYKNQNKDLKDLDVKEEDVLYF